MKTKTILVDDQVLVRNGLSELIQQTEGMIVVAQFSRFDELLNYLRNHYAELIVMEWNLPGIGGIETIRRLRKSYPGIKILIVSSAIYDPFPRRLIEAGANGLVSKKSSPDEFNRALKETIKGQQYMSVDVVQQALAREYLAPSQKSPFEELSNRELQVMKLAVEGERTRDISHSLSLSPKTVSTYRHRLYDKLGVKGDVELTRLAIRYGVTGEQFVPHKISTSHSHLSH
ncbi:MAG: response regulator [Gammaproteobacteria bacterium]|nr:response regulator [Gammaproteobacteria bacterium]